MVIGAENLLVPRSRLDESRRSQFRIEIPARSQFQQRILSRARVFRPAEVVVAESVVQSEPRGYAKAVLREKIELRIVIGAIEVGLCGRDRGRSRKCKRPADGYVEVRRLILGEIEYAGEDVFAIPAGRQIAAVQAKKYAASGC